MWKIWVLKSRGCLKTFFLSSSKCKYYFRKKLFKQMDEIRFMVILLLAAFTSHSGNTFSYYARTFYRFLIVNQFIARNFNRIKRSWVEFIINANSTIFAHIFTNNLVNYGFIQIPTVLNIIGRYTCYLWW